MVGPKKMEENTCTRVNDNDEVFLSLVRGRGYEKDEESTRPMYQFVIPDPFSPITLPEGFLLMSLVDDCDWVKVNRVLWCGFGHAGEPPAGEEELDDRKEMFDAPSARRDLKIVVKASTGDFVSICGIVVRANP